MIALDRVCKGFGGPLLSDLDLRVRAGEVFGLMGPAASGKSVLLKLVAGLMAPDSGRVVVAGQDLTGLSEPELMPVRAGIGMLFQNNALFDFLDVLANVAFPLLRAGVPRDEAEQRAAERLRRVGLAGSERKQPSQLSGGMKKRVGIARASVGRPGILIYDEPTAGLDPVTTSKIYDLILEDHEAGGGAATVLVVSSDVESLCRRVATLGMLYQGRLRYSGPAAGAAHSDDPVVRGFVRGEAPEGVA